MNVRPPAAGSLRTVRLLGRGGMGEVWLCRDDALGVDRAVKFLLPERAGDAALRARFAAEARTLAALGDVPGVVRVHAAGEDPATWRPFIVMDAHLLSPERVRTVCTRRLGLPPAAAEAVLHAVFAEFESRAGSAEAPAPARLASPVPRLESHAESAEIPFTLQDALGDEAAGTARQIPERSVLSLAREIAAALARLHGRAPPVVHRDLKPSNLLFAADGRLLLADFGVAKTLESAQTGLTRTGAQPGTQRYAAPELLRGDPATPAADWYSLGVVLFRALTSSFPQWGEAFPTHEGLRPFSPRWEPLLRDLLAPDPARRLADPAAFSRRLDALEKALDRPRGSRRRRFVLPAVSLAAIALLGAGVATLLAPPVARFESHAESAEPSLGEAGPLPEGAAERSEAGGVPHAKSAEHPGGGSGEAEPPPVAPTSSPAPGQVRTVLLPGDVPLDLVWIPPGAFLMGEGGTDPDFLPHRVELTRGFWLARTELTEAQWAKAKYGEEGRAVSPDIPRFLTWDMAEEICRTLDRLDPGFSFRLPTEAEWEWAARGGPLSKGFAWSGSDDPDQVAWTRRNAPRVSSDEPWPRVATRKPNELGLFDMSGNFHEWCSDWFGPHGTAPETDPPGPASGTCKVVRGGSFENGPEDGRVASRGALPPSGDGTPLVGLRVAATELP